jgi:hypothetical protein
LQWISGVALPSDDHPTPCGLRKQEGAEGEKAAFFYKYLEENLAKEI